MNLSENNISIVEKTVAVVEQNITQIIEEFYTTLLKENPSLHNIFNKTNQENGIQRFALANSIIQYAKNLKHPDALSSLLEMISSKHSSLDVRPEQYSVVGNYLMKAIVKVLGELDNEILNAWSELYWLLANTLIKAEKTLYDNSLENSGWNGWKKFTIIRKEKHNDEITSFYVKPSDNSKLPDFKSGQYISVKIFLEELGFEQPRQYSLSEAQNNEYLRISIKKEIPFNSQNPNCMISQHMHDKINVGDEILITAPHGNFTIQNKNNQLVFLAGGIGITPIISMIYSIQNNQDIDVLMIYSYRDDRHGFELERLKYITKNNPNIKMLFYATHGESKYSDYQGFINFQHFCDKIKNDANFYICGPEGFVKFSLDELKKLNINKNNINYELFSPNLVK
jgi:nitric oxide dioxygenase